METPFFLMTNFQSFKNVVLSDKILPRGNFRQYNDGPLNIFPFFNYRETSE